MRKYVFALVLAGLPTMLSANYYNQGYYPETFSHNLQGTDFYPNQGGIYINNPSYGYSQNYAYGPVYNADGSYGYAQSAPMYDQSYGYNYAAPSSDSQSYYSSSQPSSSKKYIYRQGRWYRNNTYAANQRSMHASNQNLCCEAQSFARYPAERAGGFTVDEGYNQNFGYQGEFPGQMPSETIYGYGVQNQYPTTTDYQRTGGYQSDSDFANRDSAATELDRKINERIRSKLSGWFSSGFNDTIILRTDNGIVVIHGTVEKPEDIQSINDSVKDIEGVRNVSNRLTVARITRDRNATDPAFQDRRDSFQERRDSFQDRREGFQERREGFQDRREAFQGRVNQEQLQGRFDNIREGRASAYGSTDTRTSTYGDTPSNSYANTSKSSTNKYPMDAASNESDRQLNTKIRSKLGGWFSAGYNDTIILRTANGVVTIEGTVDSPDDIQKVTDTVSKIDGVRSVNNRLAATKAGSSTGTRSY